MLMPTKSDTQSIVILSLKTIINYIPAHVTKHQTSPLSEGTVSRFKISQILKKSNRRVSVYD